MKVLIIRFSSIGDIVLTSPVIRSLNTQLPDAEVHYLTKAAYQALVQHNPYIHKVHLLGEDWRALISALRAEHFDYIIDLHQSLRSRRVRLALRRPSTGFRKRNLAKWLLVRRKRLIRPIGHVVRRYGATLDKLGLSLDEAGLDCFIPPAAEKAAQEIITARGQHPQWAIVLGAKHATKRWLPEYFIETLNRLEKPVLLLGGPDARSEADHIISGLEVPYLDAVGKYPLMTSIALLDLCPQVLTHDTGLMHVAAALQKRVHVLWGSTVPALGFSPYRAPQQALEAEAVACRPCHKIGRTSCPLGHFNCMNKLSPEVVISRINSAYPRLRSSKS